MTEAGSIWERLRVFFTEKGFRPIGAGAYGRVYGKPSANYVLKIFEGDPCYNRYLSLITNNKNTHFPVMLDQPQSLGDDTFMVRLERLGPASRENVQLVQDIANTFIQYSDLPPAMREPQLHAALQSFAEHADLIAAIRLLYDALYSHGCFFDLAQRNLMQRRDGTVVILDPVARS